MDNDTYHEVSSKIADIDHNMIRIRKAALLCFALSKKRRKSLLEGLDPSFVSEIKLTIKGIPRSIKEKTRSLDIKQLKMFLDIRFEDESLSQNITRLGQRPTFLDILNECPNLTPATQSLVDKMLSEEAR